MIEGLAEGGTIERRGDGSRTQALGDEQILSLTEMCQRVAEEYGVPQDMNSPGRAESCTCSRAPDNFPLPTPVNVPYAPLRVMFSLGAVQGFLDLLHPWARMRSAWR